MISEAYFFTIVALLTIGTVAIRGSFIALARRMTLTPKLRELFGFIPAAIFPALIVPVTFFHHGQVDWLAGKERFTVLLLSGLLCYFIRSTLAVVSFGLLALYLVTNT